MQKKEKRDDVRKAVCRNSNNFLPSQPTLLNNGEHKHKHERTGEGAATAGRLCACELSASSKLRPEGLRGILCECALISPGARTEPIEQGYCKAGCIQRALGAALSWSGRCSWKGKQE